MEARDFMLVGVSSINSKSFDAPDESRQFPFMESELVQVGPIAVGRAVLEPGWRWSTSLKPVSGGESCQVHHITLVLSGRIRFEMEDGETAEFGPNTLVDVPPGHDAWVVGDEATSRRWDSRCALESIPARWRWSETTCADWPSMPRPGSWR